MEVAIHLVGEAPGAEKGGILEQELREIEVQALPDKIPSMIAVDISKLEIGDAIAVKDVVLPEGVEIIEEGERTLVTVLAPKAEKAEETAAEEGAVEAAEAPAEPEVISEKEAAERRKEKEATKTEKEK